MANVTKVASRIAGKAKGAAKVLAGYPGIFHHLSAEHAEVATLMHRVRDGSMKIREELFPTIRASLLAHSRGEEEEFYPQLRHFPELQALTEQCLQEHRSIKEYIEELDFMDKASEQWNSTFGQMMEAVEKHVELEEETVFPKAKGLLEKEQAERMLTRYEKVEKRAKAQH